MTRTALIVGAGPGLGEAIARRFARGGYRIGLIARSPERVAQMADRLRQAGAACSAVAADAADEDALREAMEQLATRQNPPDVAIYNAARLAPGGALETTSDRLRSDLAVNLLGAHVMARHVAPAMIAQGHGALLFTGGGLALEPYPEWTSLALGKAALRSLAFSLYKELAPQGVHVSVIAICGLVAPGGSFDPDLLAEEYWRLANAPGGLEDREVIFQPPGTDPYYNDPGRMHRATTRPPVHTREAC